MTSSSHFTVSRGSHARSALLAMDESGVGTREIASAIPISQRRVQMVLREEGRRSARTPALTPLKQQQIAALARLGVARENIAVTTGSTSSQVRAVVTELRARGELQPDLEALHSLLSLLGVAG